MFLIRQSKPEDVSTLLKLARTVYFINLPPDERIIAGKVEHSRRCFRRLVGKEETHRARKSKPLPMDGLAATERDSDSFMFTILDKEGGPIGTSQVRAHMGGPGNPNWRFAVSEKRFYSEALRFGTTHTVGRLEGDETGPTEVGGLILDPGFRGHSLRPGKFLSFVRFHFIGLYRAVFARTVLAEMLGHVTSDGDSPFWDAFGRKFIPYKYADADRFCQYDRSFISDLLPKEEVYLTLMPMEIVKLVGQVSTDTAPARRILEQLGFKYRGCVDPFDGGPHVDVPTDSIPLVKWTRRAPLAKPVEAAKCRARAIVSVMSHEGEFRATETLVDAPAQGSVRIPTEAMELLGVQAGDEVGITPLKQFAATHKHDHARPSPGTRAQAVPPAPAPRKKRAGKS
ncbi:MAG: arginine N-succinyltransferase [Phycisphaerales bacterium]